MKATYQKPATDIVMLSTGTILQAISNGLLGTGDTPKDFDPSKPANTTDATSGNLSRHYSIWDEDEE